VADNDDPAELVAAGDEPQEEIGSLPVEWTHVGSARAEVDSYFPGSVSRSRPLKRDMRLATHSAFHQHLRSADELVFGSLSLEKRIRIRDHQRLLQDFVHGFDLDQGDLLQHLLRNLADVFLVFLRQ
jgi:hypothetical protein